MKRYESRYCTFAVPDDWEAEPPFAFREKGEGPDRLGAQVLERCLAEMPSATDYAREQKEILAELYEGFELLQEGPHRTESAGEGYFVAFRFLDEDENPSQGKSIYLISGPLVCQLMLTGLDGPDPERDRLFEAIGKTFSFRYADFLSGARPGALTSDILRTPQENAARGWPGPWRKFPRVCVSLPIPSGWEVHEEESDVLFRRGNAEIRLHREMEDSEPEDWFARRVERLQASNDLLLGSEKGEIERGSYVAVLYEHRGLGRTWRTVATLWSLDLFLRDQQPLVCTLKAQEPVLSDYRSLFESLVAATVFLDPAEWETKLAEPWMSHILKGPWQPQGPGLYVNTQKELTFIHMAREPNTLPLDRLQPSIVESLRKGTDLEEGFSEISTTGVWRKHDAFHYSMDGVATDSSDDVSVRAAWLAGDHTLYSIFVRGEDPETTQTLSRDLLESFQAQPTR